MKKRIGVKQRFQYWFDNLMTGGTVPIVVMLLLIAGLLTFIVSLFILMAYKHIKGDITSHPLEVFWKTFLHLLDPGTIADDDNVGWVFRLLMLIPTTMGILLVATLVGVITARINSFLKDLRKGRSMVIEEDHIVILGWSAKIYSIIDELLKTQAFGYKVCIVVLADQDKVFMEDEISEKVSRKGKGRIICRNGDPIDLDDLEIVNPHLARSIIVISNEESDADVQSIKCISAIVNHPNRKEEAYNIIVELDTDEHRDIASLVGKDELTLITYSEVMARIVAQTCLDSDLSNVYTELLDFDSVDIQFANIEAFRNKTFLETLMIHEEVVPIGIQKPNGKILLNPPMETLISSEDAMVVIGENHKILQPPKKKEITIQKEAITQEEISAKDGAKHILILGWNNQGADIVQELINYLGEGSEIYVMADEIDEIERDLSPPESFRGIQIICKMGEITKRETLNRLNLSRFSHVMILSYSEKMNVQDADAHTYLTLLYLRDIKKQSNTHFTIVSEILDDKNRILAEITDPDDFIISDQIISLIISQIAENKELKDVYDELFDSAGSEFYLKPVERYLSKLEQINFYTVIQAAAQKKEIAIGYRFDHQSRDAQKAYGVVLNPKKSESIDFRPGDKIIVLAEDL